MRCASTSSNKSCTHFLSKGLLHSGFIIQIRESDCSLTTTSWRCHLRMRLGSLRFSSAGDSRSSIVNFRSNASNQRAVWTDMPDIFICRKSSAGNTRSSSMSISPAFRWDESHSMSRENFTTVKFHAKMHSSLPCAICSNTKMFS